MYIYIQHAAEFDRNSIFAGLPAEVGRGTKRSGKQTGSKRQPFIWMWG